MWDKIWIEEAGTSQRIVTDIATKMEGVHSSVRLLQQQMQHYVQSCYYGKDDVMVSDHSEVDSTITQGP